MKQTENHQFNLIESGDNFSPEPLNDNARKTDELIQAIIAGMGVTGHNARIETGSYTGSGTYGSGNPNSLTFTITPLIVIVSGIDMTQGSTLDSEPQLFLYGCPHSSSGQSPSGYNVVTWDVKGLSWYSTKCSTTLDFLSIQKNGSGVSYRYIAIGYDD